MLLSDRIQALAPGNASHFRLKLHSLTGNLRVFPPEEGSFYRVGDSPYGIPGGRYTISFYDSEQRPLLHKEQTLLINYQNEAQRNGPTQLSLNLSGTAPIASSGARIGAGTASPAPLASSPGAGTAPSGPSDTQPEASEPLTEDELEFRKHLAALDLEERQQEFIKNSTYMKEVGEAFVLNRLMRRDMIEMQRTIAQQARQAFLDLGNSKATIQRLLELQDSVLDHVEKHRYVPPAPPPDYVGLGHAAIGMLKEVGVALIHRYGGERVGLPPAAPSQPQPQLPAASSTPATASTDAPAPASGEAARPPDVIDRIGKKLKSLTELDLAKAMSSPEAWAGLLQDCLRPEKPVEEKAPQSSQEPSIGLEG
jgi:hypothetical protein